MTAVLATSIAAMGVLATAVPASAHRDGCHRWHSCPSDSGSYVCGDLGYTSECGSGSLPEPTPEAAPPVDLDPPAEPRVRAPEARPGGAVRLTVTAERGSRIQVRDENGDVVARATATGAAQRVTFTADDGEHTYTVLTVDAAGNESSESDEFTVLVDGRKPELGKLAVSRANPSTGLAEIHFATEAGSRYTVTVKGRKERLAGTAGEAGEVTGHLALPNGTYRLTCVVRDDVGNRSRTEATTVVTLKAVRPGVRLSGAPDDGRARFAVSGPPTGTGMLTVGGEEYPVTLDARGRAAVTARLKDGEYRAALAIRDRFGRRGSAQSRTFMVDETPPPLTVSYDTDGARYGDAVVTVTGEAGARVVLSGAGTRTVVTLTESRQVFRPRLDPGKHHLTVTSTDRFGNTSRREITLRLSDEWTPGETVRALLWTVGVLLALALGGWSLWRGRRSVMIRIGRWREGARVTAEERADRARAPDAMA